MGAADGGCFCGAVRYRMDGPPIFTNCCHCTDCQKISGSAFALNALIETERLTVIAGAPEMKTAQGGRGWHCGACGALLWADHPMMGEGLRFLRVGTLDEAGAIEPDAHFFVRSKRAWVTIPDGVPRHETLPQGNPMAGMTAERVARFAAAAPAGLTGSGNPE